MKNILLTTLLILGSIEAVVKTKRQPRYHTSATLKPASIPVQQGSVSDKASDTSLLDASHYEKLATSIYKALSSADNLTDKAKNLTQAQVIKKIQGNLGSIARKTKLNIEIIDTTIEDFIIALNTYLVDQEKYAIKALSTKQSTPIIECIKEIKDSIPQDTQIVVADKKLASEEARKAKSILENGAAQLSGIADGTKKATTEAVGLIFDETKKNLEAERKKMATELTKVKDSFAQKLIKSVSDALNRMFGITSEEDAPSKKSDQEESAAQKTKKKR